MGPILRKERCHERISHRLQSAVGAPKNQCAAVQRGVAASASRRKRYERREDMENKGEGDQPAVTNSVTDQSADDDAETEA
jgi:hypothetical protein